MVFRVGDSGQVYWEDEGWFKCTIDKTSKEKGLHVLYEDGDQGVDLHQASESCPRRRSRVVYPCSQEGCAYNKAKLRSTLKTQPC